MTVDVVIPAFRDNVALADLLPRLAAWRGSTTLRVVFGESDPGGESLCGLHAVASLRADQVGRSAQMNHGAALADGDVLFFLHADSLPPPEAIEAIEAAVSSGAVGGAFSRRFDAPSRFLKFSCALADWRGRELGVFLGDQGLFVRRDVFEPLGGFDAQARYEDLDFSLRLRRAGRTVLLSQVLRSSARRFEARGVLRQSVLDLWEVLRYLLGRPFSSTARRGTR